MVRQLSSDSQSALLVLHRWELSHYSSSEQREMTDNKYVSSVALTTLAKLAIDTSCTFNGATDNFDINALPVSSSYAVFQAALFLVESRRYGSHPKHVSLDWRKDLEVLRLTLWHYSQRWKIAGMQRLL